MTIEATPPVATGSFNFDHLQIEGKTARFDMPMVCPGAYLDVLTAAEANAAYHEASAALSGARVRNIATGQAQADRRNADLDRNEDRELYPLHVVVGWGGIKHTDGAPVPWSVAECAKFIAALPDWIFDRLRLFAMRPERFVTTPPPAEELAGNS